MKRIFLTLIVCVYLFAGNVVYAKETQSQLYNLYSMTGFIQMLIDRGIISVEKQEIAQELGELLGNIEDESEQVGKLNADKVTVSVSQFIEYGTLTYNAYEDVNGLILLVKNPTDEALILEAKRGCQVVYTITDAVGDIVYMSADKGACKTDEKVTYKLGAGDTRIFEIEHESSAYSLKRGEYTVTLEYPGYGKGSRVITVE